MFTKKEASSLTGLTIQQLDYWGKSVLEIVPEAKGSKHSNVFYTSQQILELMLAISLRKQEFINSFIKGFLYAWRTSGRPLKNYVVKLEKNSDFKKGCSIVVEIGDYQRIEVQSDEDADIYLMVSHKELVDIVQNVSLDSSAKLQIVPITILDVKQQLRDNAERHKIDAQRLVA